MLTSAVERVARECGFELAGVASPGPFADFARYERWVADGMAGEMRYLTDHRAALRRDARALLPNARSVICVGKLYNTGAAPPTPGEARISRYASGEDYHDVMRRGLEGLVAKLRELEPFDAKICVDTAPLLERSLARQAGLGWIGKNTCLINEPAGSWFFLGEVITSLSLEPGTPPPDRCGTCTRCIDACPTNALVPDGDGWTLDSRRCISYLTIELRGAIPPEHRAGVGSQVFGCDICQDVCPWNRDAPVTAEEAFGDAFRGAPSTGASATLDQLAHMTEEAFRETFRASAVKRAKYTGLLRNAAVAMGNLGGHRESLAQLTQHPDATVREHAEWALAKSP